MNPPVVPPAEPMNTTKWLIVIIAAIGFAFDIYELLMLPLIIKPALLALGGLTPGTPEYTQWARALFFIPALAGGVFGLLGGYLTDRLGRRRVLTGSILLYAFSAFAAGYALNLTQLLLLRCGVFIGVCVEFVAAVAWLAELFPNPRQREKVLGYTQAFSSLGGVLIAMMNILAATLANSLPAIHGNHEAWRYTLISGVIPAIPLILIRPFLPESPLWKRKKEAGTLKRPSIGQLFSPALRKTTIVTTLVFAGSYGIAFGAIQQLPQILGATKGGHKEVLAAGKTTGEKEKAQDLAAGRKPLRDAAYTANGVDKATAQVNFWQEMGGLVGRVALAVLALYIVSRRNLFRVFQIPALIFVPLYFWWVAHSLQTDGSLTMVKWGIAIAGFLTVAQFSFWGNYIPLVFPVHLRGTGESFAANIGGRVIGTAAAWITLTLAASTPPDPAKIAKMGAIVAGAYALVAMILTHWLPEPRPEDEGHDGGPVASGVNNPGAVPTQLMAEGPRP
ncbi:MAG: MFS transporter, partial [Phycisphaerae bacterium]